MKFSKTNFSKNAGKGTVRQLGNHKEALNGIEVDFSKDKKNGVIEGYIHEGEEYYLYPVFPEWCEEE